MKITGHKTESMFKRYADLFSDEEKRAQQRASQSKRSERKKAQAENVVHHAEAVYPREPTYFPHT